MNTKKLESIARKFPPCITRLGKRAAVRIRGREQLNACREGYKEFGAQYSQPILFIAGLPKSGSTWIEKMVASYSGYHEFLLPEIAKHELATGGSHDFELPRGMFDNMKNMLVLTKMHSHGSVNNVRVLEEAGINYVILHRDLRDVAVSYHFYVHNTPWHPEHKRHRNKSVQEGLAVFCERMLPAYIDWVKSWKKNANPEHSVQLRYEDMLVDPIAGMTKVATLFQLDNSLETITRIVDAHSFKKMSGGRKRGEGSNSAFARKGVAGDWRNHFTTELKKRYATLLADFLIESEYETDDSWVTEEGETTP
ncbi:MAG: sulfotransferase domain-containing protein [Phycisphaerales bacterium]|nr:sulfotransferase domain-containing protein [Planctomycetota bacterium]MBL6997707.1 sulfotransferase domain-containing protein [Phycisphaerales bacterium]